MFQVETLDTIFETDFYHVQVNITSRCNMRCEHCRGAYDGAVDMSTDDFERLIIFCRQHLVKGGGFLISGGEPLLHPQFKEILFLTKKYIRKDGFVAITTNGSLISPEWLDFFQTLDFPELRISVSLDSIKPERHNKFRNFSNAFEKSVRAIKLIADRKNIKCIVRATIQKDQLSEIEEMTKLLDSIGVNVFPISSIIPVGSARNKLGLCFDRNSKKKLIEIAREIRKRHIKPVIYINDPLSYIDSNIITNLGEYGGCIAGVGTFSIEPDGTMLPCPLLPNQVIMNIKEKSPEQMLDFYSKSKIIHSLFERNLTGKCGNCKFKFTCGGCRARAEVISGSYLGEDPDCWL